MSDKICGLGQNPSVRNAGERWADYRPTAGPSFDGDLAIKRRQPLPILVNGDWRLRSVVPG